MSPLPGNGAAWGRALRERGGRVRRILKDWPLTSTLRGRVRNARAVWQIMGAGDWFAAETTMEVTHAGQRFDIAVSNWSDPEVIREMFLSQEYRIEVDDPRVILDLGSNVGASIAFFRAEFPGARIIGLEPDPRTFQRLRRTSRGMRGVEVHQWAVAGRTGPVPFALNLQSWGSGLEGNHQTSEVVDVEAYTFRDLLDRLSLSEVDLLKLDIEGGEWHAFGDPGALSRCRVIVGELHLADVEEAKRRAIAGLPGFDVTFSSGAAEGRLLFQARATRPPAPEDQ